MIEDNYTKAAAFAVERMLGILENKDMWSSPKAADESSRSVGELCSIHDSLIFHAAGPSEKELPEEVKKVTKKLGKLKKGDAADMKEPEPKVDEPEPESADV